MFGANCVVSFKCYDDIILITNGLVGIIFFLKEYKVELFKLDVVDWVYLTIKVELSSV